MLVGTEAPVAQTAVMAFMVFDEYPILCEEGSSDVFLIRAVYVVYMVVYE